MANELRTRTNFVGGLVEDNPLTNVATTLTSAGLAALPVIDTTNHAAIILDPDGIHGAPEIVWVTAHSASSTTATITRAQESTSARQHLRDTYWVHTATVKDFVRSSFIGAQVVGPASQSIPHNAGTALTWSAELFDTSGFADLGTNSDRFTIPAGFAGKYRCTASFNWDNNASGNRVSGFRINGATSVGRQGKTADAYRDETTLTSTIMQLAVGDYVTVSVYQDSGGAINVLPGNTTMHFDIQWIGY